MLNTFMIIDDDVTIVKILSRLIELNNLGKVTEELYSGKDAVDEILFFNPDVLLIDYLLPSADGVEIIKSIRHRGYEGKIIMISQVEDEPMRAKAYNSGILFFINKPINSIEVVNVINNVNQHIELERSLSVIKSTLTNVNKLNTMDTIKNPMEQIEIILNHLGIIGYTGTNDLIHLIQRVYEYKKLNPNSQYKLQDLYMAIVGDTENHKSLPEKSRKAKAFEQRIRRTIQKALSNIAELGHDDYYNSIFAEYSNLLFDFKEVKQEMKYIDNQSATRGRVNIKKFIEGIIVKI